MKRKTELNGTDRSFMEAMIQHNTAGMRLCKLEMRNGSNAELRNMSRRISKQYQLEIDRFNVLLYGEPKEQPRIRTLRVVPQDYEQLTSNSN